MNPAEFTLDFFLVCLSQAKWDSQKPVDIFSREHIKRVAFERGWQEHLPPHQQTFPVASPANEHQTQNKTTMNTLLKEIYDILISPVVAALNRIATALEASGVITPIKEAESTEASETATEPEKKKRGPKAKTEPAPAAPAAPEPEPEPEEPYMSGAELCDLMKPLKTTPYNAELVEYRNNVVGFTKPTREMTDPAMLRMMEAKIREFLAANEEAEA